MAEADDRRRCLRCRAWLAADNPEPRCGPCQTVALGQLATPLRVPEGFWLDAEIQDALSTRHMGRVLRAYRLHQHHGRRRLTQSTVASWAGMSQGQLSTIENGPPVNQLDRLVWWALLLGIPEEHLWFKLPEDTSSPNGSAASRQSSKPVEIVGPPGSRLAVRTDTTGADRPVVVGPDLGGIEAIELLRQVEASDVGPQTLAAVDDGVDSLCRSFTYAAPAELLVQLRGFQGYLGRLLDGRMTLTQRRELLRHAGWLSLLGATASLDVGHDRAAEANFAAATGLAREVGDLSLAAWVLETRAWQALANGDYARAAEFCSEGLEIAPRETPAYLQLCTQAARVSARLRDSSATYRHVDEAIAGVGGSPTPDGQHHHFASDPQRVLAFCAAALVWLDDDHDVAEDYARRAVAQFNAGDLSQDPPHYLVTARMNLALHLACHDEPEEATHVGRLAFESSSRLCHTDLFLADDLDRALASRYRGDSAVTDFHDRYLDVRTTIEAITVGEPAQAATGQIASPTSQLAAGPNS